MRKKLRRGAILALVLVLLFSNTVGATGNTGATVTVNSYEELVVALEQAENMGTIVINSMIVIPKGSTLGDSSKQVIFKYAGSGYIEFEQDNNYSVTSTVENIIFDGDGKKSLNPMLRVRGKVDVINCEFKRANAGTVYAGYADVTFTDCTFFSNKGTYGGHFNAGYNSTAVFDRCSFSYGTATTKGGGIYIDGNTAYVTLKNSIVTANESPYGAGIYNAGNLILESTLLYNNHATKGGDDLCSTKSTYEMGSLEDMEQEFKEQNITIKPLSWEKTVDEYSGDEYFKLLYTTATPDPDPIDPDDGGNTGGEDGKDPEEPDKEDPTTPPEEDKEPEETPPAEEQDPKPSLPNEEENGGGSVNIDNSQTDNSQNSQNSSIDNSVSDSSSSSTVDNSQSSSSSTVDNSSVVSNTDNSSSRSESSRTENSNNSTATYNYYQTKESTGGTQTASQPISVNITVPQEKRAETAPQEPVQAKPDNTQNISIDAEGVDLKYEVIDGVVSISIKQHTATASPIEEPKIIEAVNTSAIIPEAPQEADNSPNWVEYATMFLLFVLVLGELGG